MTPPKDPEEPLGSVIEPYCIDSIDLEPLPHTYDESFTLSAHVIELLYSTPNEANSSNREESEIKEGGELLTCLRII